MKTADWKDELKELADIPVDAPKGFVHISYLLPKIESLLKKQRENCMLEFQAGYKKRL